MQKISKPKNLNSDKICIQIKLVEILKAIKL